MKVLVATEKPFAKVAVDGIRKEIEAAGFELALLEKYTDKAQLLDAVKDANAIIIRSDIIDAEVLDAAKELKIVVRAGAGYDNVDLAAATAHNVCVMNTPGQNSNAVAELALQSPYAVARYYQVPLWSQEHLDAMRPLMKMLADAGQKIITATLMHKPWNGQTEDYFDTMVTWMKRADGTWSFDYTIFDRWVEFMMSVGIDKQINCYSMVPWELSFQYYDQATNSLKFVKTAPGEEAYEEMWVAMLSSFSKHLKEKGWFDICAIAMDERPMEVMQKTLKVIRKADPDFKVSLAGNYHAEIEPDLYDYCIVIGQNFPEEVRLRRAAENKRTNYYTCCTEAHPNTFTFSDPAEAVWISYYSSKKHLDGYLRWAYNSWPLEPLLDSRFRSWAGGDTYLVYPGARSCIRFERLIEGIQAHEKINILRQEFEKKGNKAGLKKIEKMLAPFNLGSMPETPAAVTVNRANQILNSL